MKITYFTFNPFSTNCFIASSGKSAVIVDPSCESQTEVDTVIRFLKSEHLIPERILLTHAHIDHIFGCAALSNRFNTPVWVHPDDAPLIEKAPLQAQMFGLTFDPQSFDTELFSDDDTIEFGETKWSILHTPGHSPGSVSFFDPEDRSVIAGDVLFRGSIGRTDLWQGSLPVLMRSIFQQLVPLGNDVTVYSGHGPETTIGEELRSNPFLSHIESPTQG